MQIGVQNNGLSKNAAIFVMYFLFREMNKSNQRPPCETGLLQVRKILSQMSEKCWPVLPGLLYARGSAVVSTEKQMASVSLIRNPSSKIIGAASVYH